MRERERETGPLLECHFPIYTLEAVRTQTKIFLLLNLFHLFSVFICNTTHPLPLLSLSLPLPAEDVCFLKKRKSSFSVYPSLNQLLSLSPLFSERGERFCFRLTSILEFYRSLGYSFLPLLSFFISRSRERPTLESHNDWCLCVFSA